MLKRYYVPSVEGEGYAHIVIDTEIGLFATVSDFGNYSYAWGSEKNTACEFREFLLRFDPKYTDYLCSKLLSGRPDLRVYHAEKTASRVLERIRSLEDKALKRSEMDLFRKSDFSDEFEFYCWYLETSLSDANEDAVYKPCLHAVIFCQKVMPRFQAILKAELDAERSQCQNSQI